MEWCVLATMALPGLLREEEEGEETGLGLKAGAAGINQRRLSQLTIPYTRL